MSYYGQDEVKRAGHWLCTKCHTFNKEYNNATKKVVCPFCSTPKPNPENSETAKGGEPTKIDRELFELLKNASDEQIERISKHIGTDKNLFVYMKTANLKEKESIVKFIEDIL